MEMQEREIKFYIEDLEKIAERVRLCGAELIRRRTQEHNLRLDIGDHELARQGRLLRIRTDDRVSVTYKANARVEGGVIARTEIEFNADDARMVQKLFEALGYRVVVTYEKYRSMYKLGDVVVVLDEMPFGNFVEIEAPNNTLIEGVSMMLGLDFSKGMTINYLGLFEALTARMDFDFRDLTFENFKGLQVSSQDLGFQPADK
jgi:adenylate cyclase class 2